MPKPELERLLSHYNWWIGISTAAVAIGILGEYVAQFAFEKEKKRRAEIVLSVVFGVMVLGGVAGEFVFGLRLSHASDQLQQMADADVAQANQYASQANNAAAQARREAESFKVEIAKANENAARADELAENERLARIKIEERLAPRHLTSEQQAHIAVETKSFAGQKAVLFAYAGDPEIVGIANEIAASLGPDGAGWTITAIPEQPSTRIITGILVELRTDADARAERAAKSLVSALRVEHLIVYGPGPLATGGWITYGGKFDVKTPIFITIGKKP